MRLAILVLILFSVSTATFSQITVDSDRDSEGNVQFYAINSTPIPYSVMLDFYQLQNLSTSGGSIVTAIAVPGRSRIATLKTTVAGQGTGYNYRFSFGKGNIYGKNKNEPVYLIPVSEGTEVVAMQMTHLENRLEPEKSNDEYVGVSFRFEEPVEIVAPRKGVVAEIRMEESGTKENLDYNRNDNHIELYHEDGTITRLTILKPGSERVKVGQLVFPGEVLAESAGENYINGAHVRMINLKTEKGEDNKFKYTIVPVKFATKEGKIEIPKSQNIESVHPEELIIAEMSKKEKKVYEESNQD